MQSQCSGNHCGGGRGTETDSGGSDRGDELTIQVLERTATSARGSGESGQQEPQKGALSTFLKMGRILGVEIGGEDVHTLPGS